MWREEEAIRLFLVEASWYFSDFEESMRLECLRLKAKISLWGQHVRGRSYKTHSGVYGSISSTHLKWQDELKQLQVFCGSSWVSVEASGFLLMLLGFCWSFWLKLQDFCWSYRFYVEATHFLLQKQRQFWSCLVWKWDVNKLYLKEWFMVKVWINWSDFRGYEIKRPLRYKKLQHCEKDNRIFVSWSVASRRKKKIIRDRSKEHMIQEESSWSMLKKPNEDWCKLEVFQMVLGL